jgi:hypothetical protein
MGGAASEFGATMATLADRILDAIRYAPLDDDVLARRLGVGHRQAVNQAARRLEAQGRLRWFTGPDGKIVNALPDSSVQQTSELTPSPVVPGGSDYSRITEDEVKEAVRAYLTARGFDVAVRLLRRQRRPARRHCGQRRRAGGGGYRHPDRPSADWYPAG